jgi:hypothetical protein
MTLKCQVSASLHLYGVFRWGLDRLDEKLPIHFYMALLTKHSYARVLQVIH